MKAKDARLRVRLSDIEARLVHMQRNGAPPANSAKQRAQHCWLLKEQKTIQDSLNRIIYPILTIPVEIISAIFLRCLPDEPTPPSPRVAPLLLLAICQQWRYIALSSPRLWAVLKIPTPTPRSHGCNNDMIQQWLSRAGKMPLSISICVARQPPPDDVGSDVPDLSLPPAPFWLPADSCERLTSFYSDCLTLCEGLTLLRTAFNLVRFEMHGFRASDNLPFECPPLHLTKLQSLTLSSLHHDDPGENGPIPMLLELLTLPDLRSFAISCGARSMCHPSFHTFLQRAPNIRSLTARVEQALDWEDVDVFTPVVNALSSLTTLTLYTDTEAPVFALLRLLSTSETSLPRVEAITFSVSYFFFWDYYYAEILVGALRSRSKPRSGVARLMDFGLYFPWHGGEENEDVDKVENDDCSPQAWASAHIRALVEGGMEIHIGPPLASSV